EDPQLLSKHRFIIDSDARRVPLFPGSELFPSSTQPGSYLFGGFNGFEGVARKLSKGGKPAEAHAAGPNAPAAGGSTPGGPDTGGPVIPAGETVFHASGRLVEVYATV